MNYGDGAGHLAITGSGFGVLALNQPGAVFLGVALIIVGVAAAVIRRRFRPHLDATDPTLSKSNPSSDRP